MQMYNISVYTPKYMISYYELVSWSLTSLFSTNMAISETTYYEL